jgi:hypothetical protein
VTLSRSMQIIEAFESGADVLRQCDKTRCRLAALHSMRANDELDKLKRTENVAQTVRNSAPPPPNKPAQVGPARKDDAQAKLSTPRAQYNCQYRWCGVQ